jgi:energy-coupling factor transporter ATP-binding protein EcfA2
MFLLVTGASGSGKSTVRRAVARRLSPDVHCVELHDVVAVPAVPDLAWRQRATEAVVQRALALQAQGRHLLLSGDPVAAGEVLAAPSADELSGVAVCLLDVSPEAQAARLAHRGDDPSLLPDHQAFAEWMRGHARDPRHMPHVLSTNGWEAMRWDRWRAIDPVDGTWGMEVLDTSRLTPVQVADGILGWCRRVMTGDATVLHPAAGERDRRPDGSIS